MYSTNPALQQRMMQLDQQYAQEKANIMQSFYNQNNNWNQQTAQAPAAQPQPTQNVNWIFVNGIQGAKEHHVPANATHWLMDSGEAAFYVKESDEFGTLKTFKGYRFAEIPDQEINGAPEQIDMSKYVSKEEFDALKSQLEQFTASAKKTPAKANKEVVDNG